MFRQLSQACRLAVALLQAARRTREMRSLTSELQSAQPSLESAAEAEDAAAVACSRCTLPLLQESAALKQYLAQSLTAADRLKAELPHLHMVAADLKLMSAQVHLPDIQMCSRYLVEGSFLPPWMAERL